MTGTAGVAAQPDFFKSGPLLDGAPDGVTDMQDMIGHRGRMAVGVGLGTSPVLPLVQTSDLVVAGAVAGGVATPGMPSVASPPVLGGAGDLFAFSGEKSLYIVNPVAAPNNHVGIPTGPQYDGRRIVIRCGDSVGDVMLMPLGPGAFYGPGRSTSTVPSVMIRRNSYANLIGYNGGWIVETVAAMGWRTQGTTDANGDFLFTFPEAFTAATTALVPNVSVGPGGLGTGLLEVRVTALSQTSVRVNVRRYPVVTVLAVSVVGAPSPASGVTVNVDVRVSYGG